MGFFFSMDLFLGKNAFSNNNKKLEKVFLYIFFYLKTPWPGGVWSHFVVWGMEALSWPWPGQQTRGQPNTLLGSFLWQRPNHQLPPHLPALPALPDMVPLQEKGKGGKGESK